MGFQYSLQSIKIQRLIVSIKTPSVNKISGIIIVISTLIFASCNSSKGELEIDYVDPINEQDIVRIDDSLVRPIEYLRVFSLKDLPVQVRKQRFIHLILPSILISKHRLGIQQQKIRNLLKRDSVFLSKRQKTFLDSLYRRYKTRNPAELIERLHTHPVSIVLAQAALESAWGTSRFYSEAKNVFGIWSFDESEDRIPSIGLRNGSPVYLKKYRSLTESVDDYFLVLGRGPFSEFREIRMMSNDPYLLANYLVNYSEKRQEYSSILKEIIKKNNLTQYDRYAIDPAYIR
jgi:Bax protein